jgi:pilus assembly protein Flp/PilA
MYTLLQHHKKEGTMTKLVRFIRDEEGVTALEYALIAALIAVVIIVAVTAAGTWVSNTFQTIADALSGAAG